MTVAETGLRLRVNLCVHSRQFPWQFARGRLGLNLKAEEEFSFNCKV